MTRLQREAKYLRQELGLHVTPVERWDPHARRGQGATRDLLGFADLLALDHVGHRIILVQVCGRDWSSHVTKLTSQRRDIVRTWIQSGGLVWLVGWRKLKQGWTRRFMGVTLEMVTDNEQQEKNWWD